MRHESERAAQRVQRLHEEQLRETTRAAWGGAVRVAAEVLAGLIYYGAAFGSPISSGRTEATRRHDRELALESSSE